MVQFGNLANFQVMIFLLIAVGYLLRRLSVISAEVRAGLTDLLILFILPCNIVNSFFVKFDMKVFISCGVIFLISAGMQVFCELFSRIAYRRVPHKSRMVLKYGTLCPNSSFLGNPLIEGLYGTGGLLYASIYLIPQRIVMWSWGVACFTGTSGKGVIKKVVSHPCIIAAALGLLIMVFQIPLPAAVTLTVSTASSATTAVTMLVIGGILAEIDFRTVLNRVTLLFSFIRLLLLPLIVLAFCRLISLDPLVSAVSVVLTGMPAGATTAILAEKYSSDSEAAVKCVFVSTVLSLVSIPALCVIIEYLFR